MMQKLSPWLAAGVTTGLVVILGLWVSGVFYFNTFILGHRSNVDQKLAAAVIEASIKNPEIQNALKDQVLQYLKSPEGKAKLAELMKSPEMVKTMSENLQTPEMRAAILKLMEIPEFRAAVLTVMKDTPEMKVLTLISSAVVFDQNQPSSPHPSNSGPTR